AHCVHLRAVSLRPARLGIHASVRLIPPSGRNNLVFLSAVHRSYATQPSLQVAGIFVLCGVAGGFVHCLFFLIFAEILQAGVGCGL
ncbi:hypothetical protein, partial [Mangrovibacter sp. MFB070]|uniref:hypothetical protein n=1 Tax=Mangrovibacter sp. MFB070 TaxID=1224318 RepID=UPI001F3F2A36